MDRSRGYFVRTPFYRFSLFGRIIVFLRILRYAHYLDDTLHAIFRMGKYLQSTPTKLFIDSLEYVRNLRLERKRRRRSVGRTASAEAIARLEHPEPATVNVSTESDTTRYKKSRGPRIREAVRNDLISLSSWRTKRSGTGAEVHLPKRGPCREPRERKNYE